MIVTKIGFGVSAGAVVLVEAGLDTAGVEAEVETDVGVGIEELSRGLLVELELADTECGAG